MTPNRIAPATERLRVAPSFAATSTLDGRPFIAKETEPYVQYWLTERYRVLIGLFATRRGCTIDDAIDGYLRLVQPADPLVERRRLSRAVDDMRSSGVLIGAEDDPSRYDAAMVDAYLTHRPFPRELVAVLVRDGRIGRDTRVLDLAGGPGDLALALAGASDRVAMMELSRGFVRAARTNARRAGVRLQTIHDSCNRLVHRDDHYDVVTVSQALHWLDDVLVCKGICRVLRPGGSFFVIHSAITMSDDHPLAYVLGDRSILGAKQPGSFREQVDPLERRLALLFEALDAPDVHRVDPAQHFTDADARIVPAGITFHRQRRTMGSGFARAFLTERHIDASGLTPTAFWADLEARCAGVADARLMATHDWAVIHFRRDGTPHGVRPVVRGPTATTTDRVG